MNIQARRISGSSFSAEDKLEVIFSSDNQPIVSVVHTIELVSGVNVTHGGGGQQNEYLHYKSTERDADTDGVIDYSNIEMCLVQEEQGVSVAKVVAKVTTLAQEEAQAVAVKDWEIAFASAEAEGEEYTEDFPVINSTILKTGDITLDWSDDIFV